MRVLLGTPIHQSKDYSMKRWLKNVKKLRRVYPCDFLMIDNSPTDKYVKKVQGYCRKYGITDYQIKHLDIDQSKTENKGIDEQIHERVAHTQEFIRQFVLSKDYDAWFSWECDQIIPLDTLDKLISFMKLGNFMMVNHNCWDKNVPDGLCFDWGVTLVSREYLKKYGFMLDFKADPKPVDWYHAEAWYRKRLLKDGSAFADLCGVISPILHI